MPKWYRIPGGSGAAGSFIVRGNIHTMIRKEKLKTSPECWDELDNIVRGMVRKAIKYAKDNHRTTVLPRDF